MNKKEPCSNLRMQNSKPEQIVAPQHSLDLKFYFYSSHGTKNSNMSQIHSNRFIYF